MPRWEPNGRDRLVEAAITLFVDGGFDSVTVDDIASAAGLTRSTFFRHFRDKAEILFVGQDGLAADIRAALAATPDGIAPLEAARHAVAALEEPWFAASRRAAAAIRASVIEAHPALRERELVKRAAITDALARGLACRGVDEPIAQVAAQLAILALDRAVRRWTTAPAGSYATLVEVAFTEVEDASRELLGGAPTNHQASNDTIATPLMA